MTPAAVAVDLIIEDLTDRKGLGDEWSQIDAATIIDIKTAWIAAIQSAYSAALPPDTEGEAQPVAEALLLEFYRTYEAIEAAEKEYYERAQGLDARWEVTERGGFDGLEAEERGIDDLRLRLIDLRRTLSTAAAPTDGVEHE